MLFKIYFHDNNGDSHPAGIILNIEASYQEIRKIYESISGFESNENESLNSDKYSIDEKSLKHYEKFLKSLEQNHIQYSKLENFDFLIF